MNCRDRTEVNWVVERIVGVWLCLDDLHYYFSSGRNGMMMIVWAWSDPVTEMIVVDELGLGID